MYQLTLRQPCPKVWCSERWIRHTYGNMTENDLPNNLYIRPADTDQTTPAASAPNQASQLGTLTRYPSPENLAQSGRTTQNLFPSGESQHRGRYTYDTRSISSFQTAPHTPQLLRPNPNQSGPPTPMPTYTTLSQAGTENPYQSGTQSLYEYPGSRKQVKRRRDNQDWYDVQDEKMEQLDKANELLRTTEIKLRETIQRLEDKKKRLKAERNRLRNVEEEFAKYRHEVGTRNSLQPQSELRAQIEAELRPQIKAELRQTFAVNLTDQKTDKTPAEALEAHKLAILRWIQAEQTRHFIDETIRLDIAKDEQDPLIAPQPPAGSIIPYPFPHLNPNKELSNDQDMT